MQVEAEINVERFKWESENLAHCARHDVTPVVASDVKDGAPLFFLNDPDKTGSHVMVGPDSSDRFWTIIISPTENDGEWKPITGWPSTRTEITRYTDEC